MLIPNKKICLNPQSNFINGTEKNIISVEDFWKWAFSDFQANNIRGVLAEFIIAKALELELTVRSTWDDYDLTTPSGIKIEVKSGGFLQSWNQKKLSKIVFSGLRGQVWDSQNNCRGKSLEYRADIYIFAVQTSDSHNSFNPLDLAQWEFYVVPKADMIKRSVKSISLETVKKIAMPVIYSKLKTQVSNIIQLSARLT